MADFASIRKHNSSLARKALTGSVFTAPITAEALTRTNTFGGGGVAPDQPLGTLKPLPAGYNDCGLTPPEGARFARAQETDTINGWQSREPVREDLTSDTATIQVDFLETNIRTLELYTGADLSAVTYVNGALSIQKPALPPSRFYRLAVFAVDSINGQEYYHVRFFPRVKVSSWADQAFAKAGALQWGVTFTAYEDSVLKYAQDDMIAGPGFAAIDTTMGLPNVV